MNTLLTLLMVPAPVKAPIEMSHEAFQNTYAIATFIMDVVRWIFAFFGIKHHPALVQFFYAVVVFAISLGIGILLQKLVEFIIYIIGDKIHSKIYIHLRESRFFNKICRIIPPIVFLVLIEFTMTGSLGHTLTVATIIYMIFTTVVAIISLINATWEHIDEKDNKRKLPLKGIVQLVKGILWIIAVIIVLAILLDKSPEKLLAGLGAFAAVLMLVFKDSILGVVAGVQLSENDTLHVGDWIKVHGTDADGSVLEVTLTSVKIENWDKTVTTVPPYSLISGSFTNYKNMQDSNTRRICRCFYIDCDSIAPIDSATLENMKQIPLLKEYIEHKLSLTDKDDPMERVSQGTIETNLGLLRGYLNLYLRKNPLIDQNSTILVRTLEQTPNGVPLQLYCFTATSSWLPYEDIMDSIFEHTVAMLNKFGLCIFEAPSGRDTILEGYLPAAGLDRIFGLPYPFNRPQDAPQVPSDGILDKDLPTPFRVVPTVGGKKGS